VGLTALLTAGENGDPSVALPGDCAMAHPVRTLEVEPGVTIGTFPVLFDRSGFAGISTCISTRLIDTSEAGVDDVHGGAGGWRAGSEGSGEGS
jgi:hypothetical protein